MLKAKGLYTFSNDLNSVPEGALLKAENTIIDRDGIIESRRGFGQYGSPSPSSNDFSKQLFNYKNRILSHYSNKLAFDNGSGTFTDFAGTYNELETGLRIKGLEYRSNFYFTTNDGIKKISASSADSFTSATNFIRDAGVAKALDPEVTINYDTAGFFLEESKVAYRIVWGYRDGNDNLLIGAPSGRIVVTNISTTNSATTTLNFPIPSQILTTDTNYFYQVYRTAVKEKGAAPSLDDVDPGDEMFLVLEDFPTNNELTTTRMIVVNDVTPEDFRASGTLLYTNLNSGEGIGQSNEAPPLAKDVALFSESIFYANTRTKQKLQFSFLSVSQLVSGVSTLTITDGQNQNTYTFIGTNEITEFTFDTQANTTDGSYFLLNAANNIRKYFVWFDKTGTTPEPSGPDTVGRLPIRINISAVTTADEVAQEVFSELGTYLDFIPDVLANVVTVQNENNGPCDNALDGNTPVGGTFAINIVQQGTGEDIALKQVLLSSAITPSQQIDETARSLVNVINQNVGEIVQAYYLSGAEDLPGQILLEARDISTPQFFLALNNTAYSSQFNPALPVFKTGTTNTGTTTTITSVAHGFTNGDKVLIFDTTTTPNIGGVYTISSVTVNTFVINVETLVAGNVKILDAEQVFSENEVAPNRIYFSKFQLPEAVPVLNFFDVGPKDKAILRILALRDSLFVFKEDAIYRITGVQAPNFTVSLFDSSTILNSPDSAVVLNNQIFCLTTQGIAQVTDTGVDIISRPIEDQIQKVIIQNLNYKSASFGVGYETDRAYLLWVPFDKTDTKGTKCFRYNTFTQCWTEWIKTNTCGVVNFGDNKLYLGSGTNVIERERKTLDRTDYADYQFTLSIGANSVNNTTVTLSSNIGIDPTDIVVQTQYVTIATFNRLLRKLDLDIYLQKDYLSELEIFPGDSLTNKMIELVAKLNADPSTQETYVFSGTTNFETIQQEFNVIIQTLNIDDGVFLANYRESTGFQDVEGRIVQVIKNTNNVVLDQVTPFIQGNVTHYQGIDNDILYAPQHFGDPSVYKQINEATFIFEDSIFTTAVVSYNTDISPNFETIDFAADGDGSWGNFVWGEQSWGGEGTQVPLRTYIPTNKQRCRFIRPRFQHGNAWEKYAIQGISLNPRPYSTRAYR